MKNAVPEKNEPRETRRKAKNEISKVEGKTLSTLLIFFDDKLSGVKS